jgi:alcohol dehydrogenase class IV
MEAAVDRLRSGACDFVVGLGGGSVMDTAKAACLRLNHSLPLTEYEIQIDGHKKITGDVPPLIAIPTTAGTGSEVGRSTVITLESENRKAVLYSPKLLPAVALCDPELTLDLPPHLTAATGMDALTHNIEAYLSTSFHPLCDAIALGGIRLVARSLERAIKTGHDLDARSDMMIAASMGAVAFQKDLGVAHSLAHPLSSLGGLPHGLANAIVLPHVMSFNKAAAAPRFKEIAVALGCNTAGLADGEIAGLAVNAVKDLLARTDLPTRLSTAGIAESLIPALAAQAIADPNHRTNPRPCTEADMADLYRAAL